MRCVGLGFGEERAVHEHVMSCRTIGETVRTDQCWCAHKSIVPYHLT